ncbi:MAG: response regulator, partial [Armatimonadota bacterium]
MNTSNEGTPAPFDRSYASDAPESSEEAVAVECESVLIIEDDESVREVYEEALALRGFRVAAAPDAKTALEHARRENWSVMMVDLV